MKREEFTIILAQLQERDKKALEKLYVEYFSKIYSVALYELKNKDDAYDITMSVIMIVIIEAIQKKLRIQRDLL